MARPTYAQAMALLSSDPIKAFAMLLSGTQPDGTLITSDTASASDGGPVTPSDSTDLATFGRAVVTDGSGAVKVTTLGGSTVTIPSSFLPAGQPFPLRVKRVFATGGTTATVIWVLT